MYQQNEIKPSNAISVHASSNAMEVINSVGRVNKKNAKKSMIHQTVHFSMYVFSATQILSRRPTFC